MTKATCKHSRAKSACGRQFHSRRSDAKFCGANCRKAYSRRGDVIKRAHLQAAGFIEILGSFLHDRESRFDTAARSRLRDLRDLIETKITD